MALGRYVRALRRWLSRRCGRDTCSRCSRRCASRRPRRGAGATTAVVHRTGMGPARAAGRSPLDVAPAAPVAVRRRRRCAHRRAARLVTSSSPARSPPPTARSRSTLPGADLVAAALTAAGLPARTGPIACAAEIVKGERPRPSRRDGGDGRRHGVGMAGRPALRDAPVHRRAGHHRHPDARAVLAAAPPATCRWCCAASRPPSPCSSSGPPSPGPVTCCWPGRVRSAPVSSGRSTSSSGRSTAIDAPVYVRRQIVHNSHVVGDLERKGAVFVHELDEVPPGSTVVLAAHGVAPDVRHQAERPPAACDRRDVPAREQGARRGPPLRRAATTTSCSSATRPRGGRGHARRGARADHRRRDHCRRRRARACATPTGSPSSPRRRSPSTRCAGSSTGCASASPTSSVRIATTSATPRQNRQEAVAAIAAETDVVLVVGSPNSSNSRRLTEVAVRGGQPLLPRRRCGRHRAVVAGRRVARRHHRWGVGARIEGARGRRCDRVTRADLGRRSAPCTTKMCRSRCRRR